MSAALPQMQIRQFRETGLYYAGFARGCIDAITGIVLRRVR